MFSLPKCSILFCDWNNFAFVFALFCFVFDFVLFCFALMYFFICFCCCCWLLFSSNFAEHELASKWGDFEQCFQKQQSLCKWHHSSLLSTEIKRSKSIEKLFEDKILPFSWTNGKSKYFEEFVFWVSR